jgi:hypothetical protein
MEKNKQTHKESERSQRNIYYTFIAIKHEKNEKIIRMRK